MPDIESEIRLKSSGADQVARDLQKIKETAEDTSESLKGVQGDYASGGGSDPFTRSINQSAKQSGQTAREVMDRQERNSRELERAKDRETDARSRSLSQQGSSLLAQGNQRAQGAVTGVAQGVEQISQGGPSGLVGGIGGMMGKLLSGPAGWAALGGSVLAGLAGGQAEKAFQFHRQGYLSGTVQRLGISGDQRRGIYGEMIETGIAPEMVQQYMSSLSQSGGTLGTGENVTEGLDFAMDLGAEATTVGRLAGMSQAMGLGRRNAVANRGMLSRVLPGFGEQNVNTFLSGMQTFLQGQQQAYGGGTTEEMVQDQAAFMTNLREQGLTASSAAQLANQTAARDRQTSNFGDPTDMIALQAMREEGESVLDTMARMENDPGATREAFLERISGMSDTAQVMAVRSRYGTNVSGARRIIAGELEGTEYEGMTPEEIETRQEERGTEAVFSRQFFSGLQDTLLDVISRVGSVTGMFNEGEAAQIRTTEEGAIGVDEERRKELARQAAQYEEDVRTNSMNVEAETVEVVAREMGEGDTTDYLQKFGIDFSNTNPSTFGGMDTAISVMGMSNAGLSTAPRNLISAAKEAGASPSEMNTIEGIVNASSNQLRGTLSNIDREYGDDQGKQEMMAFMGAVKESLEKMIRQITEETGLTREAIKTALGFDTIQSDDGPSGTSSGNAKSHPAYSRGAD